jgi:DNA/RNA endonuclease G (NUC1)/PKD repeat protein
MTRRRTLAPLALALAFLSCNPDRGTGPSRAPGIQADVRDATPLIVITELMPDPTKVADASGEWFEVFNAGASTVDLNGWRITSGPTGSEQHMITGSLPIAPGGYLVFGNNANSATNGGLTVNYSYGTALTLNNSNTDWLTLKLPDGRLVDTVSYSTRSGGVVVSPTYTPTAGASRVLGDVTLDNTIIGGNPNWINTPTSVTYGLGDRGTPGSGPYSPIEAGPVVTVTVTPNPASVTPGGTRQLTATGRDADGLVSSTTFTWASADEGIATVSATGLAAGVTEGTVVITATSANGVEGTTTLTVAPPVVASVVVAMNTPRQVPLGFTKPAFPTVRDADNNVITPAPSLTWSSSDDAIATVDGLGYVTGHVEGGPVTITATASNGVFGTTTVTVLAADVATSAVYRNHLEFGTPADGDASDDILIARPQYALSYNAARGGPNWVAWNLNATQFGAAPRCDCFSPDPALPPEVYHVVDLDYRNGGYDRGHMTMSEDRTTTYQENARTFYLTNVLPQAAENNQGPWVAFEIYANDLARVSGKELYILAGGEYGPSPASLKGEGKVQIPEYTWKIVVVVNGGAGLADVAAPSDLQVLAVRMPNLTTPGVPGSAVGIRDLPWDTFTTTVDAIEAATGYDFLAALPDRVERIVEANDHFPTASGGGPYAGVEGSAIDFSALGSTDPDGDPLTYAWAFGDGVTGGGPAPAHAYADNGIYTATVIATDPYGAADTASATATVTNASPVITGLVVPAAPVAAGTPANVAVSFTDAGTADTHTLTIDWGDGTTSGTTTHVYAAPGLYTVAATVRDDDGAQDSRAAASFIVVYDPAAGFATGSGWFGPSSIKAKFAFVAKYQAGVIGDGASAELQIERTGFSFTSATVEWLVVQAGRAKVGGTGTVAGAPGIHRFLLTAVDGPDGVRIRIWNAAGVVVYDNQPGVPNDAWTVTPLGGGNISVKERGGTP